MIADSYCQLCRYASVMIPRLYNPTAVSAATLLADAIRNREHCHYFAPSRFLWPTRLDVARLDADRSILLANRVSLGQAFQRLMANSTEAMPRGGRILLSARTVCFAKLDGVTHWAIEFKISDTGSGIREDVRDRIFDWGFTTKPNQFGNPWHRGGGLPNIQRTVEKHSGLISLSSAPGQGAEFTILLPTHPAVHIDRVT